MADTTLLATTGVAAVDQILREIVGLLERRFAGRVRGYYLVGSYAVGRAIWTSDIDMLVLFKGRLEPAEAQQFGRLIDEYRSTCRYPLDINPDGEERLRRVGVSRLHVASLLLYGEDVRADLPAKPIDAYVRDEMHLPYVLSARVRGRPEGLAVPLGFPDPQGEFYGYDRRRLRVADGTVRACTKELVLIVACAAAALVAREARAYVGHKSELADQYRRVIGDEWTATIADIYRYCRDDWAYLIPGDAGDRRRLRRLCERGLAFENYFFARYEDFLLRELRGTEPAGQLLAARRLGQVIYPGGGVPAALRQIAATGPAEARDAAAEALRRYEP
jgi:predicted nucleotidyltransferase